jgi:hypothetical protein
MHSQHLSEESKPQELPRNVGSNANILLGLDVNVPKLFNSNLDASGKSPATALKHLNYIAQLAEIFSTVYNALSNNKNEQKYVVFYNIAFAGEIVSKQEKLPPKLPDHIRALLPKEPCAVLQDMRNNHLVHNVSLAASQQDASLYEELKKDQAEFLLFSQYLLDLSIINAIYESYEILEKINDMELPDKFSKWKEINGNAQKRIELIEKLLQRSIENQLYRDMLNILKSQSDSIRQAIHEDSQPGSVKGNRLSALLNEPFYKERRLIIQKKDEILAIAKKLKTPPIPDFCDNFKRMLDGLKGAGGQEELRDRHLEKLKEVSKKLQEEEFKEDEQKNLLLEARWHTLQVCSALEKLEEGSYDKMPSALKVLQKQMIHEPNKVSPKQEIQQIKQAIEGGVQLQPQSQKQNVSNNERKRKKEEAVGESEEQAKATRLKC